MKLIRGIKFIGIGLLASLLITFSMKLSTFAGFPVLWAGNISAISILLIPGAFGVHLFVTIKEIIKEIKEACSNGTI